MIKSFKCGETHFIFERGFSKKIPHAIHRVALRKLKMLHSATELKDLQSPPGNRLEGLKGKRAEEYSIRINDQWRLCFHWIDGHAEWVEIVDYH